MILSRHHLHHQKMINASSITWAALAALLLIASLISNRGRLLCAFIAFEFILSVSVKAIINANELWQYRETYYYFYIGYALKDLIFIAILSKLKSHISWLACLAFVPSMFYHFLTMIEIHHQYYPIELNGIKFSIIDVWQNLNLVQGNNLLLQPLRTEIMRMICSLQIGAMILAISKGEIDGGKRIIDWTDRNIFSFSSTLHKKSLANKVLK